MRYWLLFEYQLVWVHVPVQAFRSTFDMIGFGPLLPALANNYRCFSGGTVPTARRNTDGVSLHKAKYEAKGDGGMVLSRPQQLWRRRAGSLERHARRKGRTDLPVAHPRRLIVVAIVTDSAQYEGFSRSQLISS